MTSKQEKYLKWQMCTMGYYAFPAEAMRRLDNMTISSLITSLEQGNKEMFESQLAHLEINLYADMPAT